MSVLLHKIFEYIGLSFEIIEEGYYT